VADVCWSFFASICSLPTAVEFFKVTAKIAGANVGICVFLKRGRF